MAGAFEELARAYADGLSPKNESFDTTLPGPKRQEENSLERIQAKYSALVHYINVLLMEVDLNEDVFHLIYNPYPELNWLNEVSTFTDMVNLLDERVIDFEGRREMTGFFRQGIRNFLDEGLRRSTHSFQFKSRQRPQGDHFEITLLRIHPVDAARRTLALLCRRVEGAVPQAAAPILSDSTFVCRNDEDFTLLQLGAHIPQLCGYTPEELGRLFGNRLMNMVLEEDRPVLRSRFREQLARSVQVEAEFRVRHKDGSLRWISDRARLSLGPDGQEVLNCYLTDITQSRRAYDTLNNKLQRYEIILAQTENVLFEWDMTTDQVSFSDTWEKIFGYPPLQGRAQEAMKGGAYFHPDDLPSLLDRVAALANGSQYEIAEVRIATARGRYLWCRFRASAVREKDGTLKKIVGILINIDAEKQAQRLLQDKAERDALTKLLNKTAGRKQAEEYLARFPVGSTMLIIDLDNFKEVNDQHGHLFGDAVLTKTAKEIEKLFRSQDIVSRIGGDEFMVLMRGVSDRQLVTSRCQRLLNIFASTFRRGKNKLPLSCSIGIALSPEHGTNYYELFNHADQALYRAKASGKSDFCFYSADMERLPAAQQRNSAVSNAIDSDVEPGLAEDNLVRYAFQKLYVAENPDQAVNDLLALVGQQMKVSRVYIFENTEDNRFCSNTYEWCAGGIAPEIDNLQLVSYETDIPHYEDNFDEKGIFYVEDIRALPQNLYDILEPQGIKSLLHCAIREGGVFRGYIGFDECVEERMWTRDQIRLLQYFSEMLGVYLLNLRRQQLTRIQADELNTILDNQAGWLYIIDPKEFTLKYCNQRIRRSNGEAKSGKVCYQALMGRSDRCPGCPAVGMGAECHAAILTDSQTGIRILAEATPIHWQGEDSCLMSCRKLPE